MNTSPRQTLALAVGVPGLLWVVCCAVWMLAAAAGFPRGTMTLPEAAVVASHADAAKLLQGGADPNAPARVRAGLVRMRESTMTPLEAATGAIRTGPVQMLIDRGATIDDRNYAVLWCGSIARGNQDMRRFLEARRPNRSPIDCATVRPLW